MQLPFIKRAGTDPDALAYFSRAGIASGTQTPTSYDNAASFNPASSQFLTSTSNIAPNGDFTVAFWCNPSTSIGQYAGMFGDDLNTSTSAASIWNCQSGFVGTNPTWFYATMRLSGGQIATAPVTWTLGAWNFVVVQYNDTTKVLSASVNNGTFVNTSAGSGTPTATARPFYIGRSGGQAAPFNGAISNFGYWNRRLSSGANSEIAALWNSGAGRTYASLDGGLLTNLVSWWALNGNSSAVSLTDSHGGNNLTNNGSVTAPNIGPIITGYSDSRRLISDFVKGIKSLGLWNSMVCWPLRSSQNASTTLTARSLGGLGTYDAPMTGLGTASAAWGTNGVNIIGGGCLETLSTPLTTTNSIRSQLAVWNNTGGGTIIPMSSATIGAVRFALRSNNATNACIDSFDGTSNDVFGSQTVPAGFNQSAATYNFASGLFTFNANRGTQTTATRAITFSSGNITLGGWQPSNTGSGSFVLPFALVANVEMSLNNLNSVNNLYRQTLGIGLNLP
jgi:hypothetical protein